MATAALWILIAVNPPPSAAQPASFEVASIKPQSWTGQGGVFVVVRGNALHAEHSSLYDFVQFAYGLRDDRVSGGPSWASRGALATSELFQVIANPAEGAAPTADDFRLMLRTLLAERFQLKIHQVEKNFPVFTLVVAKDGSKLKPSAAETKFSMNIDGRLENGTMRRMTVAHGTIAQLADQGEHYSGRPWFDRPNLSATYDFVLEWAPDTPAPATPDDSISGPLGVSFFTALQKQLGLKLEGGTAPLDTVVIDHAEKPTGN